MLKATEQGSLKSTPTPEGSQDRVAAAISAFFFEHLDFSPDSFWSLAHTSKHKQGLYCTTVALELVGASGAAVKVCFFWNPKDLPGVSSSRAGPEQHACMLAELWHLPLPTSWKARSQCASFRHAKRSSTKN